MKKRVWANIVFLAAFFGLLAGSAITSFGMKDRVKSVQENRTLVKFEKPDTESLISGSWFQFFEDYNKDQFVGRDICMKLYYGFFDALEINERNGYVRGLDGFIMSVNASIDSDEDIKDAESYGTDQVEAMKLIADVASEYGGKVIYLNVPHKIELYTEKYPSFYNSSEELVSIKRNSITAKAKEIGITVVETYDMLCTHKDEYIYYVTDHHWTIRGAYYVYKALLDSMNQLEENDNLQYPEFDDLDITVNTERMAGSYLKRWGDSGQIDVDYMEYAIPHDMPEYTRYDNGVESERALFSVDKNEYISFMSGDIGHTLIETERDTLPSVLYVGFSYSNPLEMMSVFNFNTVASIDPRYWNGSICEYVMESKPDYIVIIRDDIYEGNKEFSCTVE